MKLIAISGWKRSGKDTLAELLVKEFNFKRVGFADPLKDMVAEEYDIPRDHCDNPSYKESAIIKYPVDPKDDFSKKIADIMFGEFRTSNGMKSSHGSFVSSKLAGEKLYWTPRALCILKGSINRSVAADYWVRTAVNKIAFDTTHPEQLYVISDLRYKSEMALLRSFFGDNLVTIRVNRFTHSESTDPSERDLDNEVFDITIENKNTIKEFLDKANEIFNRIK